MNWVCFPMELHGKGRDQGRGFRDQSARIRLIHAINRRLEVHERDIRKAKSAEYPNVLLILLSCLSKARLINRVLGPKNKFQFENLQAVDHEDSSNLDDFRTKWIALTRTKIWFFFEQTNKKNRRTTKQTKNEFRKIEKSNIREKY